MQVVVALLAQQSRIRWRDGAREQAVPLRTQIRHEVFKGRIVCLLPVDVFCDLTVIDAVPLNNCRLSAARGGYQNRALKLGLEGECPKPGRAPSPEFINRNANSSGRLRIVRDLKAFSAQPLRYQ